MKIRFGLSLLVACLLLSADRAGAAVDWVFEEGDAYSRVLCRLLDDVDGAFRARLSVTADETGRGPPLLCKLRNYEIVSEGGLLVEKPIEEYGPLIWDPWDEETGLLRRRYFVAPEVCFGARGTLRCRKLNHTIWNWFVVDLPALCPYRVKIGAMPIVWTFVTNETERPLKASGTMLLESGEVTSNPFSFHPDLDVDGAYYRDLAIVDVLCEPERRDRCGDGVVQPDRGETCEINSLNPPIYGGPADRVCRGDCTYCGDAIRDAGEICDDGNAIDDDGCTNKCQTEIVPPECGDGVVQPERGETCEIGTLNPPIHGGPADRECTESCNYCGDGVLQAGEECDDGNAVDDDGCTNECAVPRYRLCRLFRDPSFSRDQAGHPRLKANGRMDVLDVSIAGPSDDLVVDLATEHVIVSASTQEEGVVFFRQFLPGELQPYQDGGNHGYESGKGTKNELKFKINRDYTRFSLELPGDAALDALLAKVESHLVDGRRVDFQIRFENERILCDSETLWKCKTTPQGRGACNGNLE